MRPIRPTNRDLLAVSTLVFCWLGFASIPSAASASCDVPPYERAQIYPRATAKLVDPPRVIRRSDQKLRIVWRNKQLKDPVIRWFRGCRTGHWWADERRRPVKDGLGRFYSPFTSLRAPRGSLELWAEFTRYPEPGVDYESDTVMTYLGTARMSRTIARDELSVDLSINRTLDPEPEIHTSVTVTHQRKFIVRDAIFTRVCDGNRCTTRRLSQRRTTSPARRFEQTIEEIPYPRTDPPEGLKKLFETSYEPRNLPGTTIKLDQTEFNELCAAIRGGSRVQVQLTATARRADGRGKIRTAQATRTLDPALCPPAT